MLYFVGYCMSDPHAMAISTWSKHTAHSAGTGPYSILYDHERCLSRILDLDTRLHYHLSRFCETGEVFTNERILSHLEWLGGLARGFHHAYRCIWWASCLSFGRTVWLYCYEGRICNRSKRSCTEYPFVPQYLALCSRSRIDSAAYAMALHLSACYIKSI